MDCSLLAVQSVIEKINKKFLHYRQIDRRLAVVTFSLYSHLSFEGKRSIKITIWSRLPRENTVHFG